MRPSEAPVSIRPPHQHSTEPTADPLQPERIPPTGHTRKKVKRRPDICPNDALLFLSEDRISVFFAVQTLYVDSMLLSQTLQNRRFVELLTGAKFLYDTGFLEFSLEFFEGAFNIFAFLYGYYNHFLI